MAGTRSSTRQNNDSSPATNSNGIKRKAEESSQSSAKKRGRPSKEQPTLEETVNGGDESKNVHENGSNHLTEMEDVEPERDGKGAKFTVCVGYIRRLTFSQRPTVSHLRRTAQRVIRARTRRESRERSQRRR